MLRMQRGIIVDILQNNWNFFRKVILMWYSFSIYYFKLGHYEARKRREVKELWMDYGTEFLELY